MRKICYIVKTSRFLTEGFLFLDLEFEISIKYYC